MAAGVGLGVVTLMVDTLLSMGAAGKAAGLPVRWNLKDQTIFPQWELDVLRAIRQIAPVGFLTSKRPSKPEVKPEAGAKRSKSAEADAEALLRKVQDQWDLLNMKVYEELECRVELCEADVNTVRARFGDMAKEPNRVYDGVKFYAWIVSHRNISLESTQLKLENEIKDLYIGPSATVEDITTALMKIETDWPKVRRLEQTTMAAVKHALAMFDHAHPHNSYVVALQAQLDIGGKGWESFNAFRRQLIEYFKLGALRDKTRQLHTCAPEQPAGRARVAGRSSAGICSMGAQNAVGTRAAVCISAHVGMRTRHCHKPMSRRTSSVLRHTNAARSQ